MHGGGAEDELLMFGDQELRNHRSWHLPPDPAEVALVGEDEEGFAPITILIPTPPALKRLSRSRRSVSHEWTGSQRVRETRFAEPQGFHEALPEEGD
ncbi:MAG: hypothetical protein EA422_03385 [Gemmatimonadales bacterium]|nr:MAG: hypothetical protein EA422_03385 [Gemmatimonadales bacterium]